MADGSIVTFCQKNLQCSSFAAFENLRKKSELCDVTIRVENQSFSAHRVILATAIPYFQSLFSELETGEEEVAVENLDPKALESLIRFAYTGKVYISAENAQSLLRAAEFLGLTQVKDACLAFVSEKPDNTEKEKENILDFFINSPGVIRSYYTCVRKDFEELSKGEEFLNLPFSCIKEIISGDDLNVSSEEVVYEAVIKWVKFSPLERQSMLPELLREIRLTYLPVEYIAERIDSEELIMSYRPCRDLVNDLKYFHMIPGKEPLSDNLKLRPRNCLKNDLYAICACSQCRFYVYRFDLCKAKWFIFSATNMLNTESANLSVAVNGKIYIFFSDRTGVCDLKTREWQLYRSKKLKIQGATIVSYENKIYFFGSTLDTTQCVFCYDTEGPQYVKLKATTFDEEYAAGTSLEEYVYLTGGCKQSHEGNGVSVKKSQGVKKYSPSTDRWDVDVAPMLIERSHHCCTSMNGKIYVLGNESVRGEVYDPITNQWNFLPFPSENLTCISLVSDYDDIHAFANESWEIYNERTRSHKKRVSVTPRNLVGVVVFHRVNIRNDCCWMSNEKLLG